MTKKNQQQKKQTNKKNSAWFEILTFFPCDIKIYKIHFVNMYYQSFPFTVWFI